MESKEQDGDEGLGMRKYLTTICKKRPIFKKVHPILRHYFVQRKRKRDWIPKQETFQKKGGGISALVSVKEIPLQ